MSVKNLTAIPVLLALSACGGGGGSASNTPPSTAFSDNYLTGVGVLTAHQSTLTQQASMPVGNHTYNGAAFFKAGSYPTGAFATSAFNAIVNSPDVTGAVQLNADFSNNTLNGQITNIAGANGVDASGSLQIGGGVISGTTASSGLSGTLQIPGLTGNVTGTMSSNFHGSNGEAIIGTMAGTAAGDGFGGVLAAQR